MEIHNMMEELVITEINSVCDAIEEAEGNPSKFCNCTQCRQGAACYVLNRIKPYYMISHRGAARFNQEITSQTRAELTSLVYEGIRRISHRQRPDIGTEDTEKSALDDSPVFNIPTIIGRVFNGHNFSPVSNITLELLHNGELAEMLDSNWQNPFVLVANTGGTFTFMPKPIPTEKVNTHQVFEYSIRIVSTEFNDFTHALSIPVISELGSPAFSLIRTYKLPDIYLFPPGEEEAQRSFTLDG